MKSKKTGKNVFVSIIIPTHNRYKIIGKCINTILSQTYKNYELIIVDDHSSDNTIELLQKIGDKRLKILKLVEKSGAQAARNEGIKNALGDWICFNDSDDFWIENKLEIHIDYLEKLGCNKNIVFYTDCFRYDEAIDKKTIWNLPKISFLSSYKSLLKTSGPMFQGLFFHKSLIINGGLLDESVPSYQEWDTSLILAKNKAKFYHIKEPLFIYNIHLGQTISKDIVRDFNGYQYIINKYRKDIINYSGISSWKKHILIQYRKIVNIFMNQNNFDPITVSNIYYLLIEIQQNLLNNKTIKGMIKKSIFYLFRRKNKKP